MFKRILFTLVATALLIGAVEAKADKYTVATDCTFPPMEYLDEEKLPVGFDPALIKEIAKAAVPSVDDDGVAWGIEHVILKGDA